MLETYDQYAYPRLERESLCQTIMRTVSHRVSTQNGTRQCRDSRKKIRALETGWDPADAKLAVILSHHVRHA